MQLWTRYENYKILPCFSLHLLGGWCKIEGEFFEMGRAYDEAGI
jgi:hypothetical protein